MLSVHPQYHAEDGETLEQGTEPPTAPCVRTCVRASVCGLGWMGYSNWVGSYTNFLVDISKCCYIIDNRTLDFF